MGGPQPYRYRGRGPEFQPQETSGSIEITSAQREVLDDLLGQVEVCEMTGASRSLVSMWLRARDRNHFPEPLVVLRAGPFFSRREVQAWWDHYSVTRSRR